MDRIASFEEQRKQGNQAVLELQHLGIKRFYNLDTNTYRDGALPGKVKELLGLVASLVLRCNDCVDYHLIQCAKAGWRKEELVDALHVALVVGGSIVIPHLRHAALTLKALEQRGELES
ncbi:MAG: carboxymuconolactone decarboxylase family protein [Thermoanaerobaculum sp.]|nr:carboxymuconolactone decarboxylase family protein [Thermoanaerobaculum sp.]MDW7967767.1 carboxymuconolactone decarboxylase family protein [Thermoanaerobaculum sp.]